MPRFGLGLRDIAQQGKRVLDLLLECGEDIRPRHELDIRLIGGAYSVGVGP